MKTSHRTMIALATTAALLGGGLAVQSQAHAQSDPSVLTYNIKQGELVRAKQGGQTIGGALDCGARNASGKSHASDDMAAVAQEIQSTGASVVMLQEVDHATSRNCNVDQATAIADALGWPRGCFGRTTPTSGGWMGNAIISKEPITSCTNTLLSGDEPRGLLAGTTSINGTPVTVMTTHLTATLEKEQWKVPEIERLNQAKTISQQINQTSGPLILGGDLNAPSGSAPLNELANTAGMTDSLPARGNQSPTTRQGEVYDHVLLRGLTPTGAKVFKESTNSDHYPVRVNVAPSGSGGSAAKGQNVQSSGSTATPSAGPATAEPSATTTPTVATSTSSTSGRTARPSARTTRQPSTSPSMSTASGWGAMKGSSSGSRSSGLRVR